MTAAIGSSGRTPEQTLSRILQEQRDDRETEFLGHGRYRLVASPIAPASTELEGPMTAARVPSVVHRIVRDTAMVRKLKIEYGFRCQLCAQRLELRSGFYCEAHHLRPLGAPPEGPDDRANLIVVCPNHHAPLDFAAIPLSRKSLKIDRHEIGDAFLCYHNHLFEDGAAG